MKVLRGDLIVDDDSIKPCDLYHNIRINMEHEYRIAAECLNDSGLKSIFADVINYCKKKESIVQ